MIDQTNETVMTIGQFGRLSQLSRKALRLYEEAVASAHEAEFPLNASIGCELAGRFQLERSRENEALAWLRSARQGYEKWGAHAKVESLNREFKQISIG